MTRGKPLTVPKYLGNPLPEAIAAAHEAAGSTNQAGALLHKGIAEYRASLPPEAKVVQEDGKEDKYYYRRQLQTLLSSDSIDPDAIYRKQLKRLLQEEDNQSDEAIDSHIATLSNDQVRQQFVEIRNKFVKSSDANKASIPVEDLLGENGAKLYYKALEEERYDEDFINAVAKESIAEKKGPRLKTSLIIPVGAASGTGKTYGAEGVVDFMLANAPTVPGSSTGNTFSYVDNGNARKRSVVDETVIKFATGMGFTGITNTKAFKAFKTVKDGVQEAAAVSDGSYVVLGTLDVGSKIRKALKDETRQTVYAYVVHTASDGGFLTGIQAERRAYSHQEITNIGDPIKKLPECKKYDSKGFAAGQAVARYMARSCQEKGIPTFAIVNDLLCLQKNDKGEWTARRSKKEYQKGEEVFICSERTYHAWLEVKSKDLKSYAATAPSPTSDDDLIRYQKNDKGEWTPRRTEEEYQKGEEVFICSERTYNSWLQSKDLKSYADSTPSPERLIKTPAELKIYKIQSQLNRDLLESPGLDPDQQINIQVTQKWIALIEKKKENGLPYRDELEDPPPAISCLDEKSQEKLFKALNQSSGKYLVSSRLSTPLQRELRVMKESLFLKQQKYARQAMNAPEGEKKAFEQRSNYLRNVLRKIDKLERLGQSRFESYNEQINLLKELLNNKSLKEQNFSSKAKESLTETLRSIEKAGKELKSMDLSSLDRGNAPASGTMSASPDAAPANPTTRFRAAVKIMHENQAPAGPNEEEKQTPNLSSPC